MQQKAAERKVLVFAPHPDDEAIGCGGSIAQHHRKGDEVTVVYLTSAENGERDAEAKKSSAILGVYKSLFLGLTDGFLAYSQDTVGRIAQVLNAEVPDIVYMPHSLEGDLDHKNTFEIVSETLKKFYRGPKPTVLCYEIWTPIQMPNYCKDISEVVEIKRQAILAHKSQVASWDFVSAALGLNSYRAIMNGKGQFCEAFTIINFAGLI
jgi:LmbE family N-acetylglucosaminyl deacetylase